MSEEAFINLYGYVTRIIKKDGKSLVVVFDDESHGELKCTITKSCILYYCLQTDKRYHLEAKLKGIQYKPEKDKRMYMFNIIEIKRGTEVPI